MSIPNYLYALANHKGPAIVTAGGMTIPVKIMDIEHKSEYLSEESTFKCLVVNMDQIRMEKMTEDEYVRRQLEKSIAGRKSGMKVYPATPFEISKVIFNNPATIVIWADGTKTVVKCQEGDVYSKETGLALCIAKKALGNKGNFNDIFHKWIPEEEETLTLDIPSIPPIVVDASTFSNAADAIVDAMNKAFGRGAQNA